MSNFQRFYKRHFIYAILLVMVFNLVACKPSEKKTEDSKEVTYQKSLSFDEFMDQLLIEDLTSDLTTFVQFVEKPENFGISSNSNALRGVSAEEFKKQTEQCEKRLNQLLTYDYNQLTDDQKLDYDTIKTYLEQRIEIKDCAYYQDNLSTMQGDHIIIPGVLGLHATRFFDTLEAKEVQEVSAVEEYFAIYEALGKYLKDLAKLEREKADKGLFMSKERADQVASVCKDHIDAEGIELKKSFIEEVKQLDWLTESQREALLKKNNELVEKHMVSGYKALLNAMKDCAKKGGKVNYLSETEQGKLYYEYVVKSTINDNATVDEMAALLDSYMKEWVAEKNRILDDNPAIMNSINSKLKVYADPNLLVQTLTEKSKEYFPKVTMDWGTGDMPDCMNQFAMGLFYPQALDSTISKQTVYVGTQLIPGASNYVQTIGHEGVPGHLYNYAYFLDLDISQYRKFSGWVNSTGTLEGWTTYIEKYVYQFAGLSEVEARYLELTRLVELGLMQAIDFGVNYYGWSTTDVSNYLKEYEPMYVMMSGYIEEMVKDSICNAGPYVMGYIYLTEIKEKMKDMMGSDFNDMVFHTTYLNVGPTTFDLLRKELLAR